LDHRLLPLALAWEAVTSQPPTNLLWISAHEEQKPDIQLHLLDCMDALGDESVIEDFRKWVKTNRRTSTFKFIALQRQKMGEGLPAALDPSFSPPVYDICQICDGRGAIYRDMGVLVCEKDSCLKRARSVVESAHEKKMV